jgi:AcrR family transcriptional regulator
MATRQEQRRAETIAEIKSAALAQIEQGGATNLSLRAVSREMQMSVAGLYRYYDNRDALLTDLIADAYLDLGEAVANAGRSATDQPGLLAGALAYRAWSLQNPNRFALIFGSPVPGYSAPKAGPTDDAAFSLGIAWGAIVRDSVEAGTFDVSAWDGPISLDDAALAEINIKESAAGIRAVASWWSFVHGLVAVEMQNQFAWIIADPEDFFIGELKRWLGQA